MLFNPFKVIFQRKGLSGKLLRNIGGTALIIYSAVILYVAINNRQNAIETAKINLQLISESYSNYASRFLGDFMSQVSTTAKTFERIYKIPARERRPFIGAMMDNQLRSNSHYLSFWTIWDPNKLDSLDKYMIDKPGSTRIGSFSLTLFRQNDSIVIEKNNPNTILFQGDYYRLPKQNLRETVLEPYSYSFTGKEGEEILQTSLISPIIVGGKFKGVVGIDLDLEELNAAFNKIKPYEDGYIYLLSADGTFVTYPEDSLIGKKMSNVDKKFASVINHKHGDNHASSPVEEVFHPGLNEKTFVSSYPFKIGNSQETWRVVVVVPSTTILRDANKALLITLMVGVLGLLTILWVISNLASKITGPLKMTANALHNMSKGLIEANPLPETDDNDEVGETMKAVNQLSAGLSEAVSFAGEIGHGNLNMWYNKLSDDDMLGNALIKMRDDLVSLENKNRQNIWLQEGKIKLQESIAGDKTALQIGTNYLSGLAKLLDLKSGIVYKNEGNSLTICAGYSLPEQLNFSIPDFSLGIIGQVIRSKAPYSPGFIKSPHLKLESGFINKDELWIIFYPCYYHQQLIAVLELAFDTEPPTDKLEVINQTTKNIAAALYAEGINHEIKELLIKTQEQSEELKVQQEELREANEELEQQARELKESEAQLQSQQEELRVTNEELEAKTKILEEQQANILVKNKELQNASAALEEKAIQIEKASKYKSEFLANMSHELRTPLNSLLILSKSLADNRKKNLLEDQVEAAEIIYNSGNELLNLINDILDLSKIEAGKMDVQPEELYPEEFATYVRRNFAHLAEKKGLDLRTNLSDDLPESFSTDRRRVEQILKNLLSNAFKFTHNGFVEFSLSKEVGSNYPIDPLDYKMAFTVSDSGIGIASEKQQEIFDAFKQADGSTSRKYGGTGLGLSISKELAALLHGEIILKSEVGQGSSFTLVIPNLFAEQPTDESINKSSDPILKDEPSTSNRDVITNSYKEESSSELKRNEIKKATVGDVGSIPDDRENLKKGKDKALLIIEDDSTFARILSKMAKEHGFKFLHASSGEVGLQLAVNYKPSAVILDINLPGMDGWEVLEKLKSNPEIRHIPVHMMSAFEETIDAFKKGALGYLTKPADSETLQKAFDNIASFIDKKIRDLLLIEDDSNLQKSIKTIIGDSGVAITTADSGRMAIELLSQKTFDCMILDLGLPDMTGFELLRALKHQKQMVIPPVIVYTGRELSKEENKELHEYAESIIIKGVKSEERLLDETSLFLHRVVNELPKEQQEIISFLHDRDSIFKGRKVLIVDDDMRNVIALSKVLQERGLEIKVAENGKIGVEMAANNPDLSLVLMDIMMPEMDGFEAIQEIRKNPKLKALPIIALTAKAMKEDRIRCINAGANDYIAKPINVDKLLSLMRVWLFK